MNILVVRTAPLPGGEQRPEVRARRQAPASPKWVMRRYRSTSFVVVRGLFARETRADEQRGEIDLARWTGLGENRLELAAHGVARHAEAAGSACIGEVHAGQHLRASSRFASRGMFTTQ